MNYYKYLFVVLVYRNTDILQDFFNNLFLDNYHVIVVNSYFDDDSLEKCKNIAIENQASFISIPNKGYGFGNNVGIKFAKDNFRFDFLIISNSDVVIDKWHDLSEFNDIPIIIAPKIIATSLRNKNQNPNLVSFSDLLYYKPCKIGYIKDISIFINIAHIFSRISRELYLLCRRYRKKISNRIFAPHGSFIIFTHKAINILSPVFNDKMFLYNEELYLAFRCRILNVPIIYDDHIKIFHLEGASSSAVNMKEYKGSFLILNDFIKDNDLV